MLRPDCAEKWPTHVRGVTGHCDRLRLARCLPLASGNRFRISRSGWILASRCQTLCAPRVTLETNRVSFAVCGHRNPSKWWHPRCGKPWSQTPSSREGFRGGQCAVQTSRARRDIRDALSRASGRSQNGVRRHERGAAAGGSLAVRARARRRPGCQTADTMITQAAKLAERHPAEPRRTLQNRTRKNRAEPGRTP